MHLRTLHYSVLLQVNTNVQQANDNTFVLTLDHAESINHVVVFLTGQVPFSEGFGGSIFIGWPGPDGTIDSVSWQLLGYITNDKPSAIFKIARVKPTDSPLNPFSASMGSLSASMLATQALVGISVEPLTEIAQKTTSANTEASTVTQFAEFSQKMLENLFNFASSFAVDPRQGGLNPTETYIPASVLQQWYGNFQRKLHADPKFWKYS